MPTIKIDEPSEIASAWAELRKTTGKIGWIILHVKGKKKRHSGIESCGAGGVADMVTHLDDKRIQFCAFRATASDGKRKRCKTVTAAWAGDGVSFIEKAKMNTYLTHIKALFPGSSLHMQCGHKTDLDESHLKKSLAKAWGSHAPTKYEWRNGFVGELGATTSLVKAVSGANASKNATSSKAAADRAAAKKAAAKKAAADKAAADEAAAKKAAADEAAAKKAAADKSAADKAAADKAAEDEAAADKAAAEKAAAEKAAANEAADLNESTAIEKAATEKKGTMAKDKKAEKKVSPIASISVQDILGGPGMLLGCTITESVVVEHAPIQRLCGEDEDSIKPLKEQKPIEKQESTKVSDNAELTAAVQKASELMAALEVTTTPAALQATSAAVDAALAVATGNSGDCGRLVAAVRAASQCMVALEGANGQDLPAAAQAARAAVEAALAAATGKCSGGSLLEAVKVAAVCMAALEVADGPKLLGASQAARRAVDACLAFTS